jgi:trafficking protein particle complex subunit 10
LNLSGAVTSEEDETNVSRKIMISVPVPRLHILHTVSLQISGLKQASAHSPPIAAVGEMLMAELHIRHTRQWDAESSLKKAVNMSDPKAALHFMYEIGANPDVWLIGGQRRTQFTSKEDELLIFSIMLMPLRPGIWLLPTVEVRSITHRLNESSPQSTGPPGWFHQGRRDEDLVTETDYRSHGETIQVIPDLRSATTGVTQMAIPGVHGAGTVLLSSETRASVDGTD